MNDGGMMSLTLRQGAYKELVDDMIGPKGQQMLRQVSNRVEISSIN
jgi:hypothetical protein